MDRDKIDVLYQMLRDFRKTLVDAGVSNHTINEYTIMITKVCNKMLKEPDNG